MSQFEQSSTVVQPSRPAVVRQSVAFYVNLYKGADGKIYPGAKVFRKAANALRKANPTGGAIHLGVEKLNISR